MLMINLDVMIAFAGRSYEYACDPDLTTDQLICRICESVMDLENLEDEMDPETIQEKVRLYSVDDCRRLPSGKSLVECGLVRGSRLLLV